MSLFQHCAALTSCDYNIYNNSIVINDYTKQNIINENLVITQKDLLRVLIPIKIFIITKKDNTSKKKVPLVSY